MKKKIVTRIALILSIGIIASGFFCHIQNPVDIQSRKFNLHEHSQRVFIFDNEDLNENKEYRLNLHVLSSGNETNNPFYFMNDNSFQKYLENGTIDEEVYGIEKFVEEVDKSGERTGEYFLELKIQINNSQNFYLIMINEKQITSSMYYFSLTPRNYDFGIYIMIVGIICLFLSLFHYYTYQDKKKTHKFFLIGIFPNLIFILLRIWSLVKLNRFNIQYSYLSELITPELYLDFEYWYMNWMPWVQELGLLNFYNFEVIYQFFPGFILILQLFSFLPWIPCWNLGIPFFGANLLSGYLVYKIVLKVSKKKKNAHIAILIYYLNPMSLLYGSFCWLNPSVFIFFCLLSIYFLLNEKNYSFKRINISSKNIAFLILGIAVVIKQIAALMIPFMILYCITNDFKPHKKPSFFGFAFLKKDILKHSLKYLFICLLPILIICLPFIISDWNSFYILSLSSTTQFSILSTTAINPAAAVRFNTILAYLGCPEIITNIIGFLTVYWILLGVCYIVLLQIFWNKTLSLFNQTTEKCENKKEIIDKNGNKDNNHEEKEDENSKSNIIHTYNDNHKLRLFFGILLNLILISNMFYPRGIYKYYFLFIIPILAIYRCISFNESKKEKKILFIDFFIFLCIVLVNRYFYFFILLFWQILTLRIKEK